MSTNDQSKHAIAAVVLGAGLGTRMKSDLPKVMHPLAGRPMVLHLLDTLGAVSPVRVVVVAGPGMDDLSRAVAPHPVAIQEQRLGTGHAVMAARGHLADFTGTVLVVYGDTPLLSAETLAAMVARRGTADAPAVVVLGFRPVAPGLYGRLIVDAHGGLERIVEAKDADADELAVGLCNSGVMAVDGARLPGWLDRLGNDNAKGEYYLTDVVALARADGCGAAVVEGDEAELLGVNSRVELAEAERLVQDGLRRRAMEGGATLLDPESVHFAWDTKLGRDVVVEPNVMFGPGVTVGDHCRIRAFSHIEGATLADHVVVGPFARLRPGTVLGHKARIGNFVEIKNADVEAGAKVNHLSYIGDARVGENANVGAGTITCNYDGFAKSRTEIGRGAFIGSNTALVAPVSVGDGAIVGAGSAITRDVAADALAVTRAEQRELAGWAARFRRKQKSAEKEQG